MFQSKHKTQPEKAESTQPTIFNDYQRMMIEDEVACNYVRKKILYRPKTNAFTIAGMVFLYIVGCSLLMLLSLKVFDMNLGLSIISSIASWIIPFVCISKPFAIKLVECYQHYAKEDRRRKCLCMPTCSEYAIMAIRKYPLFTAIKKVRTRLYKTCKGSWYKIDFP